MTGAFCAWRPDSAGTWEQLAHALESLGKPDEASDAREEAQRVRSATQATR